MITGLHHLGLTVRDVEASAAWYENVLGFRRSGEFEAPDGSRSKVFLRHEGLAVAPPGWPGQLAPTWTSHGV